MNDQELYDFAKDSAEIAKLDRFEESQLLSWKQRNSGYHMDQEEVPRPKHFLSYGRQSIGREEEEAVLRVLRSDLMTTGPVLKHFEDALCEVTGAKYAVAVSSGTAALHLAVKVLGLEKGMSGITSAITFAASANCMVYCGMDPLFADVDTAIGLTGPKQMAQKIRPDTRLVLPVDYAGHPADMAGFRALADKHNLFVIEDAAHAFGSRYGNGRPVGSCSYSDMTCFSFHPVKTITTAEGGAITTCDKTLYQKLLRMRNHCIERDPAGFCGDPGDYTEEGHIAPWYYEMEEPGFNYRLSDVHASIGLAQLPGLEERIRFREELTAYYNEAFSSLDGVVIPQQTPGTRCAWHLYPLQVEFDRFMPRTRFMEELRMRGIGTQVHYIPLYRLGYYRHRFNCKPEDYPGAETFYKRVISLPLHPGIGLQERRYVVQEIRKLLRGDDA